MIGSLTSLPNNISDLSFFMPIIFRFHSWYNGIVTIQPSHPSEYCSARNVIRHGERCTLHTLHGLPGLVRLVLLGLGRAGAWAEAESG